jgi:hypothetical protein
MLDVLASEFVWKYRQLSPSSAANPEITRSSSESVIVP